MDWCSCKHLRYVESDAPPAADEEDGGTEDEEIELEEIRRQRERRMRMREKRRGKAKVNGRTARRNARLNGSGGGREVTPEREKLVAAEGNEEDGGPEASTRPITQAEGEE